MTDPVSFSPPSFPSLFFLDLDLALAPPSSLASPPLCDQTSLYEQPTTVCPRLSDPLPSRRLISSFSLPFQLYSFFFFLPATNQPVSVMSAIEDPPASASSNPGTSAQEGGDQLNPSNAATTSRSDQATPMVVDPPTVSVAGSSFSWTALTVPVCVLADEVYVFTGPAPPSVPINLTTSDGGALPSLPLSPLPSLSL